MLHPEQVASWDIIEAALARRKPPRDQTWLAEQLRVRPQAVTNWKRDGVPAGRYVQLAELFGLTVEQLVGKAPLPWDMSSGWPFPDIQEDRFSRLTATQRGEIQGKVREMIEHFENQRSTGLGKLSSSQDREGRSKSGT